MKKDEQELSDIFINENGVLCANLLGDEVEIIGCRQTPFGNGWSCINHNKKS